MEYKLEDICDFYNGGAWSESEYVESGIPVVKVSNIKGNDIVFDNINYISESNLKKYQKNILKTDDVVIATVGSHPSLEASAAGRSIIIPKKIDGYLLNQNAVCLRTKNNDILDQKYLGYLAETQAFKNFIQNRGGGAANQMRIPIGAIKSYKLKIPKEQKKIAKILSSYDDLIENNLKQIKLLEEKARLTYEEWFLRFRIDGQKLEIDEETGLPFGWERVNVNSLYSIKYGKNLPQEKIKEQEKYAVYGASGQMGFYEKSNVDDSVILVTSRGNGSGDIHRTFGAGFVTNNSFIILAKDDYSYLSFEFTIYHLETIGLKNYCSGSAQPQLTNDAMKSIKIILPTQEHIKSYLNIVRPLIAVADNLRNQNQLLKESRDILLPRLMTGMIDVENLDIKA